MKPEDTPARDFQQLRADVRWFGALTETMQVEERRLCELAGSESIWM
jgi:hypothetical protein